MKVDELKAELERLKDENENLRGYADFKRDIKNWRNWLKLSPLIIGVIAFLVWDGCSGNSSARAEKFFSNAHSGIITGFALGAVAFVFILRLDDLLSWWIKRRRNRQG